MRVPKQFELQGRTIRVVMSTKLVAEAWAQWEVAKDRITIDPEAPTDVRMHAFLHEFLHAAFEACGRNDLSEDEKLVDALAGHVHQMLKSARY